MSENIVSLKEALIKKKASPPLEIPAAGHLVGAAVLLERIRDNANTALLGMHKCPERTKDIGAHLQAIRDLIFEAEVAFDTYAEILTCEGRA